MDWFWQHIIRSKATNADKVPAQERIFRMIHVNKLLRMTYDDESDAIYCKLENIHTY